MTDERRGTGGGGATPARRWLPPPATLCRAAYVAVVVLATVSQISLPVSGATLRYRLMRALPSSPHGRDVIDAARNLVLFAGWGVVWVVTGRARGRILLLQATASGLALSVVVEAVQLFSPVRFTSLFDVMTNTAGAFAGAVAAAALWRALRATRGRVPFVGAPLFVFAGCYAAAVLLEGFSPLFREARHPEAWGPPLRRFAIAMARFDPATLMQLPLFDVLLFAPAGALALLALIELRWRRTRAAVVVAAGGAAACALAELARGFVGYVLSAGAVLVHGAAVAAGAFAAWAALPAIARTRSSTKRSRMLLAVYAFILVLWSGRPFLPERSWAAVLAKMGTDRFIPLRAYREQFDLHTAADALIPALLFLPVGVLLAAKPLRAKGVGSGVVPAIAFAAAVELLQLGIRARTFDITDVLIPVAALGTGWILALRAGYAPAGSGGGRNTSSFWR